ncbi:UNKNOWN [Stylonychia lemnae]|uniref:Uncharacterized protein n=1 Tax=Stylonychia lemnae TaxID=5949 RepID=A0A077ZT20_STYLE|nr:UNKNOWN [Stylonychia lemnae]|eukprot:CDW71616.1 UNKNOWN [Stylonychia lemnae]
MEQREELKAMGAKLVLEETRLVVQLLLIKIQEMFPRVKQPIQYKRQQDKLSSQKWQHILSLKCFKGIIDNKIRQLEEQAQSKNKQLNSARGAPISRNTDLNAITSQKSSQSKQSTSTVQHVKQGAQITQQQNNYEENHGSIEMNHNNESSPNNFNNIQQQPNSKQSSVASLMNFSDEYQQFLSLVNLQNPQQYRQKKMSISNLLRMIEEIYAFRYQKDTSKLQSSQSNFNPADKALYVTVFDYLNQKFKQKKMLDQATIDFIVSIDYFRNQSTEVQTFYNFFIQNLEIKDLMFYLYMRSLAEKEINQVITRMNTGDVRLLKIPNQKCVKLIRNFFQNISNSDNIEDTSQVEEMSQIFLETLIEEAIVHDKYDEIEQKMSFSFFLESLLKEFQEQQQKGNDSEIVVSGQDQFSLNNDMYNQQNFGGDSPQLDIRIDDVSPFSQNISGIKSYKQSTGNQNFDNFNLKLRSQDNRLDLDDSDLGVGGYQGGKSVNLETISNEQKYVIKDKILKYVIGNKLNQVISFMLSHYSEELSKEVLDIIKEEIRNVLSNKIKLLLDAAFSQSENQWVKLLMISQYTEEHRRQFQLLILKIKESVTNTIHDMGKGGLNVQMRFEDLEDLAKMILHVNELKQELAKLVGSLTLQARVGIETESDDHVSFNNGVNVNMALGGNYRSGDSEYGMNNDPNDKSMMKNYLRNRY